MDSTKIPNWDPKIAVNGKKWGKSASKVLKSINQSINQKKIIYHSVEIKAETPSEITAEGRKLV